MDVSEKYMLRCLELARLGAGYVAPNPMVGCVIVQDNKIIGEGYHQHYGQAHAEVNAINAALQAGINDLSNTTLYVSLEPCFHHGQTPPCVELILAHRIKEVVIGSLDPNPLVAGQSVAKLKDAGIEVVTGILEAACQDLMCRFLTFIQAQRPYIILKWAQTRSGIMASGNGQQRWITNPLSRRLVHRWRSEEAAILVGTHTARIDNPMLDTRYWGGPAPTRVILDRAASLAPNLNLFDQSQPTFVFTEKPRTSKENLTYFALTFDDTMLPHFLQALYEQKLNSLIVEGGPSLLQTFIEADLWDEARVLTGDTDFEGKLAPRLHGRLVEKTRLGSDELDVFKPNR